MSSFSKDPNAVLDYYIDWSDWMTSGDSITASAWATESGITIDDSSYSGDIACVWLSGGTVGCSYRVTNHITTVGDGSNHREEDRTITITMQDK